jgi:hypothetical protein
VTAVNACGAACLRIGRINVRMAQLGSLLRDKHLNGF